MSETTIDYGSLLQAAIRRLVQDVLTRTAEDGLPGEHHFFLTFRTDHPAVRIPDKARREHPETMTIVLRHQFWELDVDDDGFGVTLAFSGERTRLYVPWVALTAFVDPAAEFGLELQAVMPGASSPDPTDPPDGNGGAAEDNVVAFDRFRRK